MRYKFLLHVVDAPGNTAINVRFFFNPIPTRSLRVFACYRSRNKFRDTLESLPKFVKKKKMLSKSERMAHAQNERRRWEDVRGALFVRFVHSVLFFMAEKLRELCNLELDLLFYFQFKSSIEPTIGLFLEFGL